MADVRPFRGLRYDPRRVDAGSVLCPPFDVISPDEQTAYHARSLHNVVRVELGTGTADPAAPGNRYESAAQALDGWQSSGVLLREAQPAIYLHEQRFTLGGSEHVRRGVIVAGRLHAWDEGHVLPHEGTRQGPKQDRLALMRATHTNVSPLWLLYEDERGTVRSALEGAWREEPVLEAESDGQTHSLRVVTDSSVIESVVSAFASRPLYIADGHHRYETAQHYRDERCAAGQSNTQSGHEFAMMLLVSLDDPGLLVLPTHRLVRGIDLSGAALREALGKWLNVAPLDLDGEDDMSRGAAMEQALDEYSGQTHKQGHVFGLMDAEGAWLLTPRQDAEWKRLLPDGHTPAWSELDVSILDSIAIREVCGIRAEGESGKADATSHAPSDRLAYVSDFPGAVRAVRVGEAQAAFFLNATRVEQVCAVAAARDRMPPKSTFFYPKPATGLVLHPLDGTR